LTGDPRTCDSVGAPTQLNAMTTQPPEDLAARNKAIVDSAIDAIITIDETGLIETINQATTRMLGYARHEVVGKNVSMLMPEPSHSEHDSYMRNYLDTGEKKIIGIGREVVARRKDGSTLPVHLAVTEFYSGEARMFTGVLRDISQLKQAQEQLLQSARLAAIGQMVTGLAHESRNALQRAQAFLDMLALDLADSPEQLELTQRTQKALHDLHRLYEEVRNYAAPIQLECRPAELLSVCQKVWGYLEKQHKPKKMRLETSPPCELSPSVDVHRIEQVFRNILENAIDACPEHACVTVTCKQADLNGEPAVCLAFHDDGPGLDPDVRDQIFEPFFTTRQKGTGLGLAICRRIIQAHGGRITAAPECDVGARILTVLPMKPPETRQHGPQTALE